MYEQADDRLSTRTHDRLGLRLWRYAPLLFWIGVIIFGSGDGVSSAKTSRYLAVVVRFLLPGISDESLSVVNLALRKTGHFTVYAALALLAARAFLTSSKSGLRQQWFFAALALVAVCAVSDEYHQTSVPSRTGTIYDSLIDIAGGAFALTAVWFIRRRLRSHAVHNDYS